MINLSLSHKRFVSYSFIWMFFVIPPCVFSANDELHKRCSRPFSCGNQRDLFYPFWIPGREECGHPDFKLDCRGGFAELNISSVKFRILEANYNAQIIRLARSDFINNLCPSYQVNGLFDENVLPFAPVTEMLTIYFDCKLQVDITLSLSPFGAKLVCPDDRTDEKTNYYVMRNISSTQLQPISGLLNDLKEHCNRNVSIPANGPALTRLQRIPSEDDLKKALTDGFELGLNQECLKCINSKGACGYNLSSDRFACYHIKNGLSAAAKAGIGAASGMALVIFILAGLFCFIRRRKKTQEAQYTSKDLPTTSNRFACYSIEEPQNKGIAAAASGVVLVIFIVGAFGAALATVGLILIVTGIFFVIGCQRKRSDDLRKRILKALIPLKQYSYAQVKRITNSFSEVVGKGGFGTVYRGTLSDGRSVAVKILKDSKGNGEDFINEVASISKTSHVNIVSLLGFCYEGSKRAIIYEYLENGSLDQFISNNTSMNMDWMALYKIALGVARGLEYLHHGCKTRIVHFDIKPQNVLLDDNLCPKVSDFGLAKLCGKKESIFSLLDTRGTIGYIAPEVFSRMYGRVSHKSDVYSYGMLVLEMIGARNKERADQNSASNTSSMYFPEWIYKDLEKGDGERLTENEINIEEEELAKKMTLVGLWCIQSSPSDRPAMNRVVEMMEGNLDTLEVPPRPVFPEEPLQESSMLSENISVSIEV